MIPRVASRLCHVDPDGSRENTDLGSAVHLTGEFTLYVCCVPRGFGLPAASFVGASICRDLPCLSLDMGFLPLMEMIRFSEMSPPFSFGG